MYTYSNNPGRIFTYADDFSAIASVEIIVENRKLIKKMNHFILFKQGFSNFLGRGTLTDVKFYHDAFVFNITIIMKAAAPLSTLQGAATHTWETTGL